MITPGDLLAPRQLTSVSGDAVPVPDADQLVHLQFRRFAGCPICNIHLPSIVRRHDEIANAGIRVTNLHPTGGRLGRPADFLIGSDGRVIACKHGTHANDQWSVDEVLAHGIAYRSNA
jgi:hypothetical protein